MKKEFKGLIIPLITPFNGGKVDYYALQKITEYLIENGANGLVALGTTAESPMLTATERKQIVKNVIKTAHGLPVMVGAGSNDTATAVEYAKEAESLGADGILSVTPYYNLPQESGLIAHYQAIISKIKIPVTLYNVPKRTGVTLSTKAIKAIYESEKNISLKEASDNLNSFYSVRNELPSMPIYCGNDFLVVEELQNGAKGIISAAANALPKFFSKCVNYSNNDNYGTLKTFFQKKLPAVKCMYLETNPAAIKYYMHLKGLCKNELRLPMCPISHKNAEIVKALFKTEGEIL